MRRVGWAMLMLAAPSCAASLVAPPPHDYIHLRSSSWGMPVAEWAIDAAGNGRLREPVHPDDIRDRTMTLRRIAVGPAGYRRLVALLAPAERAARSRYLCRPGITDQVHGSLEFMQGGAFELPFDYGCITVADRTILAAITTAGNQIHAWAARAPATIQRPRDSAMSDKPRHEPQ